MKTFCDLSSNNGRVQRQKAIAETDGVIIKATEGSSYVNPYMTECYELANSNHKMIGFYHYARPEKNSQPIVEVLHFIRTVYPYIGKYPMFLDWEGAAVLSSQQWARDFLDVFYRITGVRMCIYCSESVCRVVGPYVADGNYGLWVAKYSSKKPNISPWRVKLLWQFTSRPYDKSVMYGDESTWEAYAKRVGG